MALRTPKRAEALVITHKLICVAIELSLYISRGCEDWWVMNTFFEGAHEWAENEFGGVKLGDQRRTRRAVQVATGLARCPSGTLPSALRHWKELKGAYRLFSNERVSHPALLERHCERTLAEC